MGKEILSRCGFRCDLCLAYKKDIGKNDQGQILSDGWFKYRIERPRISEKIDQEYQLSFA